jgi:fatty acid desaturase
MSLIEAADDLNKPDREPGQQIRWYRTKISREQLAELNRKSDLKGLAQTLGYLVVLASTGSLFVWTCFHQPLLAVPTLLLHGTVAAFLINGFHELVHDSVFKTRPLNRFFLTILSFLGWYNHIQFWASHTEHHKFTLHPPDDLEVVLPQQVTLKAFLKHNIFDWQGIYYTIRGVWRTAQGKLQGEWETYLFTKIKPEMRPALHRWARIVLVGHGLIIVSSIATGFWPVAIAVSFARWFGSALHFLCNASQHIGLVDRYPDYRLCCRTFTLNPVVQFLYWHMNYHTEHHMYAGVPCYNLGKLHRLIRHDLPPTSHGLIPMWREIGAILRKQASDPTYQYIAPVPNPVLSPEVPPGHMHH